MKKILIIILMYLLVAVRSFAATNFVMTFTTPVQPGGSYKPLNVVAAWVTDSTNGFVKTICRWAQSEKSQLTSWYNSGGKNDSDTLYVDGKMGATRSGISAPSPLTTIDWNLKNKSGNVVPDGTYNINFEISDGTRKTYSGTFVKDSTASVRTIPNNTYFANISITYVPLASGNTAPVANSQSVTNAEDTAKLITLTATDAESNTLTYAIASNPAHGTLSAITATNQVTYTPATNYYGSDSFTFTASDASLTSTPATVSITVTPVNDPPVAQAQSLTATDGNVLPIILSATDAETNALTYNLVSLPVHGHLLGASPSLTYVPVRGLSGSDSFTFNAFDGMATGNTAAVSITLVFIDSSSNGIPDSWQSAYGITDAAADPDGDGASNYAEYMAGTDPTNKTSVFSVNVPQITGGSNVVLRWSSVQYRFYSVLTTTNLVSGWSTLASNNLATPPQNVYTGTYNQAGSVFYRVQLDP